MFQEENPGDCEALTHISPQCVIFAPAAEGRERVRSCSTPPARPRPFPGSPRGLTKSGDFRGRRRARSPRRGGRAGAGPGPSCGSETRSRTGLSRDHLSLENEPTPCSHPGNLRRAFPKHHQGVGQPGDAGVLNLPIEIQILRKKWSKCRKISKS